MATFFTLLRALLVLYATVYFARPIAQPTVVLADTKVFPRTRSLLSVADEALPAAEAANEYDGVSDGGEDDDLEELARIDREFLDNEPVSEDDEGANINEAQHEAETQYDVEDEEIGDLSEDGEDALGYTEHDEILHDAKDDEIAEELTQSERQLPMEVEQKDMPRPPESEAKAGEPDVGAAKQAAAAGAGLNEKEL